MIWTIVFAILLFSLIIFVHELGHFLTARLFRVKVHEFAIGMGTQSLSWQSSLQGLWISDLSYPFALLDPTERHGLSLHSPR